MKDVFLIAQVIFLTMTVYAAGHLQAGNQFTGTVFFGSIMSWVCCVIMIALFIFGKDVS